MATNSRDGGENTNNMDSVSDEAKSSNQNSPKIQSSAPKRPSGLEILAEAAMFSQKQDTEMNEQTENMQTENIKTENMQISENSFQQVQNTLEQQNNSAQQSPQAGMSQDSLDLIQKLVLDSNGDVSQLLNQLNMTPEVFELVLTEIQRREDEKRRKEAERRAEIYKQLASLKNEKQQDDCEQFEAQNVQKLSKPTTLVVENKLNFGQIQGFQPVIQQVQNPAFAQLQAQQQLLLQLQQISTTSPTIANFQARQQLTAALSTNSLGTNSNSSLSPMTGPNSALTTPQNQFIPVTPTMDVVKEEEEELTNEKSVDDQVDEHFLKSLGEKWKTLKKQTVGKFSRKNYGKKSGFTVPISPNYHQNSVQNQQNFSNQNSFSSQNNYSSQNNNFSSPSNLLSPNRIRIKPNRSASFTNQTAPQRPTSLMNGGLLVPRKTSGGGSLKISKTGPACVNYTGSGKTTTLIGRLSNATTPPTGSKIISNQPVLSHLISVPYIIPSKQKRAIERNAKNLLTKPNLEFPRIEVSDQQSGQHQMTDSELLQASIAREKLERDHAMAREAAMQQVLQAQSHLMANGGSSSEDLLEFKSKLNSLKMLTDPMIRQFFPSQ